jgi:type II secretory pathway component GspD/PulD (secretin)
MPESLLHGWRAVNSGTPCAALGSSDKKAGPGYSPGEIIRHPMNRLFQLFFATACFAIPAMASDAVFTFECKRVSPSEMIRVLRSLSALGISSRVEDRKVIVSGGDPSLYKRVEELMEAIDAPRGGVPTRFIKLRFAEPTHVARVISEAFPAEEGNEEMSLQAAPNTRTNEVFLMGTVQDIQAAEALVGLLDRAQVPVRRGCGEAGS